MKKFSLVSGLLAVSPVHATAFAHSGKTDADGCHTEKKTGEYHCHDDVEPLIKEAKTEAKTSAKMDAKTESSGTVCTADVYNCPHFDTHDEAQATFENCFDQTRRDVHGLDGDDDGDACENLP